jgi:hypothetical protein
MAKITREEVMAAFFPDGVPKHLLRKPASKLVPPKAATQKAKERWSDKPTQAVVREHERAETALLERLEEERCAARWEEQRRGYYQGLIDATWQRNLDYQAELAQLGSRTCHRGPGDPDW